MKVKNNNYLGFKGQKEKNKIYNKCGTIIKPKI